MSDKKLIQLRKLKKYFPVNGKGALKAVEDVSFTIYEGEKFGVVGESGCGKSTLGRTILQLYKQTSGSCVYYGKSIQEIDPEYIKNEIEKLPTYQSKAKEFYDKALELDSKASSLEASKVQYDVNGNSKDAKEYDKLSKQIAKLQFESKELKKDASRQLREGSRTVGSLILCKDLDKVQDLFNKAHKELHECHNSVTKLWQLKDKYENNKVVINQIEHIDEWIKEETDKEELNPQEKTHLEDLYYIKKKNSKFTVEGLQAENKKLEPQIVELEKEVEDHKNKEEAFRKEAFDKYRGKDILPITELTLDKEYQDKLDSNYETGVNLSKLTNNELRSIRPDLQMVFQDPAASLDPRQTIGKAIEEVFAIHTDMPAALRREKTLELLTKVNLKQEHYYAYPHSLSGGMKQRAGIARAIALDPSFIVLDEAVSALDVSVQAQILQLLNQLRDERNLTYLFITHDLGVVKHFCDRVLVMYLGNVCELASASELFKEPLHPYTKSLLDAVPRLKVDKNHSDENILQGEVPSPINPPKGCPFHTRCKNCMEICKKEKPKYTEVRENHFVACHLFDERGNK